MNPSKGNPLEGLYVTLAVLDSKMLNLQSKINCIKENKAKFEKTIEDEGALIAKMEKDINDYSQRETKILSNIDNLRQTKKFLEDLETNLKHKLVMVKDKCEADKESQKNLLDYYNKIADEYHAIYNSLPASKELNSLRVEKLRKTIEIELLKKKYNDYKNKIKLFNSINDQRLRFTIISFVKALVERNNEINKTKMNFEYEKEILEEIKQLEERKKILKEKIANKAKDTVAEIRERTASNQSRFIASKVSTNIFKTTSTSVKSIKEKLGLDNRISFYRPETILSHVNSSNLVTPVQKSKESSGISSADKRYESSSTSMAQLNIETDKEISHAVTDKEEDMPLVTDNVAEKENLASDQVTSLQNQDILLESTAEEETHTELGDIQKKSPEREIIQETQETPSVTADVSKPRKDSDNIDEIKNQKKLQRIKRNNILIGKTDYKEPKKIRRVSFKTGEKDVINLPNLEKNIKIPTPKTAPSKKPISPPLAEPTVHRETKVSEISEPRAQKDDDKQIEELEICSSPDTSICSVLPENFATSVDDYENYQSPTYERNQNDEAEEVATPQMSSYFLSPAYNGNERSSHQPNSSRNEDNAIYNFPMGSSNTQLALSPPFSKTVTATPGNNKGLDSFFGGPSSGKGEKAKSFFDLF